MAESLVGDVVILLGSAAWQEADELKGFHPDFDDMKEKLVEIRTVLRDAENQSSTHEESRSTERWLQRLRCVAYDIQDVLGDYRANAAGKRSTGKKIMQFFSKLATPENTKIKELKQRLDDVARDPLIKKFNQIAGSEERPVKYERFVPEKAIVGRDDDKVEIMKRLQNVPILPIHGLPGVGKSTIARIIFDEAQGFHKKIWVTVTRDFSWERIAKGILEERHKMELPREDKLVMKLIEEKLQATKCLLVLDDLWVDDDKPGSGILEQLKQLIQKSGQGSQAIVTTRSATVAKAMCNITRPYKLNQLSDDDKVEIMKRLQNVGKDKVPILPIHGLPGVGKSTIARIIFDEAQGFDKKIWVTVTRNFSWERIAKGILEERHKMELPREDKLVMELIKEKLQGTKCLIVLDDLWDDDKSGPGILEQLKELIQKSTGQGSQAIVTTRSATVAEAMCNITDQYKLNQLSDDDCWVLFSRRAFTVYPENRSAREEVGKEIVKKCAGLPLGALSLGSIMSQKKDIKEWEAVRDSELWSVEEKYPNQEERVTPSIKLSYYYMPPEWRLCFQYCAVFPKGFEIDRQNLIQQWVALDMVGAEKAEEYLNGLTAIYFLQISKTYGIDGPEILQRRNEPEVLRMHDMVHEVAKSVGGDFILVADLSKQEATGHGANYICRYALYSNYNPEEQLNRMSLPPKTRALRLHLSNCKIGSLPLKDAMYLRVLDYSGCSLEGFPASICDLKYLRYLDASDTPIKKLTGESTELPNLLFLNLSNTSLEVLPSEFPKLRKLISLNLSCCRQLKELPCDLGECSDMEFLDLSSCTMIQTLPESICKLTRLGSLNLANCEGLQRLPESFGHLTSLEHLDLSGCSDLEQLPESFGHLPNLILLDLSSCSNLHGLPETSNGGFKKLQHLYLSRCPILKNLPVSVRYLERLETLDLVDCYNFEDGPHMFPNTLMGLDISNCKSMDIKAVSFAQKMKLKTLRLTGCQISNSVVESLGYLTELEYLDLSATKLEKIPESFGNLVKLENLVLFGDELFAIYKDKCFSEETIAKMISLKNVWALDPALASKVPADKLRSLNDIVKKITKKNVSLEIPDLSARSDGEAIAQKEKIRQRSDVGFLYLKWIISRDEDDEPSACEVVLQKLQPHQNLSSFTMENYPGCGFPSWILESRSLLPKLGSIGLQGLRNCANLPPFGELPNLSILTISSMPMLMEVTMDICGQNSRPFRKLAVLILSDMENLEKWHTSNSINGVHKYMFPALWNLKIENCFKLRFKPSIPKCMEYGIVNSDKVLERLESSSQSWSPAELPGPLTSPSPYMMSISGGRMSSNGWELLQSLHTVRELEILPPPKVLGIFPSMFTSLSDGLPESIQSLINLKRLHLSHCKNLPDWLGDFAKLEMLTIEHCYFVRPLRESLQRLTALETLVITSCSGRLSESIPSVPSLRALVIRVCKDLDTLPVCLGQAQSLEVLHIIDCPNLRSIPLELHKLKTSGVLRISTSNQKDEITNFAQTGWMNQIVTPIASHYLEDGTSAAGGRPNEGSGFVQMRHLDRLARSMQLLDYVVAESLKVPRNERLLMSLRWETVRASALYDALRTRIRGPPMSKLNWDHFAPLKVKVFFWSLRHRGTHTRDALHRRGDIDSADCPFCPGVPEDIDHLFISCPRLVHLWALLLPGRVAPASVQDAAESIAGLFSSAPPEVGHTAALAVLWCLWRSRNRMILDANQLDVRGIVKLLTDQMITWWALRTPTDLLKPPVLWCGERETDASYKLS